MMMMSGPVCAWTAAVTRAWMSFWLIRSTCTCTPACLPNSAACCSKRVSAAWTKCDHWRRWSRVPRGAAGAWAWARMPGSPPATAAPVVAAAPRSQRRRVIPREPVVRRRSSRVMAGSLLAEVSNGLWERRPVRSRRRVSRASFCDRPPPRGKPGRDRAARAEGATAWSAGAALRPPGDRPGPCRSAAPAPAARRDGGRQWPRACHPCARPPPAASRSRARRWRRSA